MIDDAPRPEHSHGPSPREHSIERLLSLLDNATEGSRELDAEIARQVGFTQEARGKQRTAWWRDPGDKRCGYDWFTNHPPEFTTSLDAALSLCPERGDMDLLWRIILERKPVHTGPAWLAQVREHGKNGGDAVAHTAALALCLAALKARSTK